MFTRGISLCPSAMSLSRNFTLLQEIFTHRAEDFDIFIHRVCSEQEPLVRPEKLIGAFCSIAPNAYSQVPTELTSRTRFVEIDLDMHMMREDVAL